MATADVAPLLDIASSSPQADPTPVETVEAPSLDEGIESTTPAEGAETATESAEQPEKPVDGRTIKGQEIRTALKEFRDLKPENAPIARALNDAYGRYTAYKAEFPTVAAARDAKALLDAVGGNDGLSSLQATIKNVNETDQALYSGDPKVLESLYEDMRSEGKQDAFTKLAGPYLDKLRTVDRNGYFETLRPHFFQNMVDVGMYDRIGELKAAIGAEKPDLAMIKAMILDTGEWFDKFRNSVETGDKSKLDPERQAFEKERGEFQTQRQQEFQSGVATACETANNRELGTELGKYFKQHAFFKSLSQDGKQDLGLGIKQRLFNELKADKSYQSQMDAFFSVRSPDKAKIEQYHAAKVKGMAARIVKQVIETRYPTYSRAGAKPAAAAPKPGVAAAAQPTGGLKSALFVSAKPTWEQLDMDKDPNRMLFAAGYAYRKNDGKLVTWIKRK